MTLGYLKKCPQSEVCIVIKIGDDIGKGVNLVEVNNRRIVLTKFDAADPRYGHGDHALIR